MSLLLLPALLLASLPQYAIATSDVPPFFPIRFSYGGYPLIMTDINYGTPEQRPSIPTVVDLGSANYWVYSKGAIANYGGQGPFAEGPCNITVKPTYDVQASTTATKIKKTDNLGFSYGNGGKGIYAYGLVNDTICFGDGVPCLKDQQVALSIASRSTQPNNPGCVGNDTLSYDHSILGISRFNNPTYPTTGPSFRQNLLDENTIETATMSMWFDKHDGPVNETRRGTVMFGAVPEGKYAGKLTQVPLTPPSPPYVGYYVAMPKITSIGVNGEIAEQPTGEGLTDCLLDSGFGTDNLPFDQDLFLNTSGLILYDGYPAFDGPCDSIPHSAALNYTFAGVNKGESVTISVPLRDYAKGATDYLGDLNKCGLSMELSTQTDCYLGSSTVSGFFLAANDDKNEFAIAQGGVSTGATEGVKGLGKYKIISKGDNLPY